MANALLGKGSIARGLVFAICTFGNIHGQTREPAQSEQAQTTTPLAFAVLSVKPAPPGTAFIAPDFMRDKAARILGLQRMVAPVNMLIGYAYGMQMSEDLATFRKQPDWTKKKLYTLTFRADGEPTRDQVREMMRTMLADRFGLQIREFTSEGVVNKLVLNKPGILGPNLKPHPAGASCLTQDSSLVGHAPDTGTPSVTHCGLVWYYLPGMVLHEEMNDITVAALGRALASGGDRVLGTHPVVDATELTGTYDVTLEFRPVTLSQLGDPEVDDGGAPTLIRAMKEQLGIRVESGPGQVKMFIINQIAEPTPD